MSCKEGRKLAEEGIKLVTSRTVFVGGLHGMMTAKLIYTMMEVF